MAQNKNTKNSEGLCQKIHNAVSPFRARIRRISHQPQGSSSIISNEKPLSQNTQSPVRISSPHRRPVRVLHQPSHSKTIPVEFEPHASHLPGQEFVEREVVIVKSHKFSKSAQPEENDDENKFSDYIRKVKDRMMKTASNVSGGGGETSPIRDSFNDKVTNYINRTKIKVRKTTSVGDDKRFSLK